MKKIKATKVTVKLRKAEFKDEWRVYLESYPIYENSEKPERKREYLIMEQNITFENLPKAVAELSKEISEIKSFLIKTHNEPDKNTKKLLSIDEASKIIKKAKNTIYALV